MAHRPLTLMAVHAHPDDEATSTGGILARYGAEGIRTVLVTCTDGALGDGPGGVKPGEPGHDHDAVVTLRQKELEQSCAILGIAHLELLGYADSGMMGWEQNDAPGSFWSTPVDVAAGRLADVMARYRPDVVVTYDANGFYGHPDHIQAHRITMAAAEKTGIAAKVYFTTIPRSAWKDMAERMREAGIEWPGDDDDETEESRSAASDGAASDGAAPDVPDSATGETAGPATPEIGSEDEDIAAWIDVRDFADRKYDALAAHASQGDNIFFLRLDRPLFRELMGQETFLRAIDRTGAPLPEDDLFAGLRA
jgi:LmbE family N-acetylglucosaminyl deacetylase